ncbi:ubl carboxyl-terminal hydrolase 18-like [Rhincodon typus]|uniref:ubl carboxyl-terminal hydrolase 18-like n=1 Tax=Rhincodon typus TaxID=259920 RepID=UPI00202DF269|nr:ubl carboxyl-terminal hydrolase 18-like [Rhincodon typus]
MYNQDTRHGINKGPRKESTERKPKRDARLHSSENTINRVTYYGNHKQNTVDPDYQQMFSRISCNNQTFVRLANTSNNCCVNALLQTLFMIPEYSCLLSNCQQKGLLIKANSHILYHLGKVFQQLHNKTKSTVSPDKFIRCLVLNHINVGSQMDAEELFRSLCNLLQDQLKKTMFNRFVDDLHVLTIEEYGKCLKCQNEFQHVGHMLTIPLSLYEPSSEKCYQNVTEFQILTKSRVIEVVKMQDSYISKSFVFRVFYDK